MNHRVNEYFWPDSELEKVEVDYDLVCIYIHNDMLNKLVTVRCEQCLGIANLVLWDEVIIEKISVNEVSAGDSEFVDRIKQYYDQAREDVYKRGFGIVYNLEIRFVNGFSFNTYCQGITVIED